MGIYRVLTPTGYGAPVKPGFAKDVKKLRTEPVKDVLLFEGEDSSIWGGFDPEGEVQFDQDAVVVGPRRTLWHSDRVDDPNCPPSDAPPEPDSPFEKQEKAEACNANLISSLCSDGLHVPTLDIDFGARLLPSRTQGHYHLYLDKPMPWWRYRVLLRVLAWAGIIEKGYYLASVRRRMTMLRWDLGTWMSHTGQDMKVEELKQIARMTAPGR